MSASNSTALVNPRAQRGERIAARYNLKPKDGIWHVPSESQNDGYITEERAFPVQLRTATRVIQVSWSEYVLAED